MFRKILKKSQQVNDSEIFTWEEFFERYTKNHEEFSFYYKNQVIHLITDFDGFYYNIGTEEKGYKISNKFSSPQELLEKAKFDGKSLKEIWDELE